MDFQVQLERAGGSAGAKCGGGGHWLSTCVVRGVRCSRLITDCAVLFGDVSLLT